MRLSNQLVCFFVLVRRYGCTAPHHGHFTHRTPGSSQRGGGAGGRPGTGAGSWGAGGGAARELLGIANQKGPDLALRE